MSEAFYNAIKVSSDSEELPITNTSELEAKAEATPEVIDEKIAEPQLTESDLKARIEALEAENEIIKSSKVKEVELKQPNIDDYSDYDSFASDSAKYNQDLGRRAAAAQIEIENKTKDYIARSEEFAKKTPDYPKKVQELTDYLESMGKSGAVPISNRYITTIMESGAAVIYELAKTPTLAAKLAKLEQSDPIKFARELIILENKVKGGGNVTKAPEPIVPVKANGTPIKKQSVGEMSDVDWRKAFRRGEL